MKTGIVRRVDDLGRIVIPKELRIKLRIEEGDALEECLTEDGNGIELRKYQPYATLGNVKAILFEYFAHNENSPIENENIKDQLIQLIQEIH